jgi:hypothetical protein
MIGSLCVGGLVGQVLMSARHNLQFTPNWQDG